MILAVHSVAANEHDSIGLKPLIRKLGYNTREVYVDKGYQVPANVSYFHSLSIKDRIQKKSYRNRPISRIIVLFNKLVSKTRWVVERTAIKSFGLNQVKLRYKGLARLHDQHLMEAMVHNLYRAPGIIMRCS
ncbi:MAG: transposase [Flavobacteriales bacterium Tduv]